MRVAVGVSVVLVQGNEWGATECDVMLSQLFHRFQHVVQANTKSRLVRIEDELWVVAECRACGAELCRWFYRRPYRRER